MRDDKIKNKNSNENPVVDIVLMSVRIESGLVLIQPLGEGE